MRAFASWWTPISWTTVVSAGIGSSFINHKGGRRGGGGMKNFILSQQKQQRTTCINPLLDKLDAFNRKNRSNTHTHTTLKRKRVPGCLSGLTGSKSSAIQNSSSSMSSTSYNRSHSSMNGRKFAGLEDQKVARKGILKSSRTVAFEEVRSAEHCTVVFCWAPFSPSSDTKTCLKSSSFQMKSSKGTKVRPLTVTCNNCTFNSIQNASEAFTVLISLATFASSPWASLSGADSLRTPKRPSYSEASPTQTHSKLAVSEAALSPEMEKRCQERQ